MSEWVPRFPEVEDADRPERGPVWWLAVVIFFLGLGVAGAVAFLRVRDAKTSQEAEKKGRLDLLQIGLAMQGYHDANGHFPPADGKLQATQGALVGEGLSWRVALLPYLEQEALYRQFHLDEPWDSPHNLTLLEKMPEVYRPVGPAAPPGHTCYRVFTGDGTFGRRRSRADITDGSSNTILVADADEAVPWTKPAELPVARDRPLPALGQKRKDGKLLALFADGRVHLLSGTMPPDNLRWLIGPDDGQVSRIE